MDPNAPGSDDPQPRTNWTDRLHLCFIRDRIPGLVQSDKTLLVIRWADLFPLADGTDGEESDRKWQDLLFPFSLLSGNIGGADAPAGGRYRRVQ